MKSMPASKHLGTRGRFELVRKLGEGGMGTVYEAIDAERDERIALKLVAGHDGTALQRFKHEFRALQDIEHPNLVRLGELHEADGEWFITMELVLGTDLLGYVREDGEAYDEARLRAAFQQLALGLRALHVAGKVHRDIKPPNIRVTPEGRVVILDFGLVIDRTTARMSTEGNVVGTVAYMAPEQASAAPIEAAADWYAFGIVLYEALTGTVPFSGGNLQVLMDKLRITPPPPRARVPDVPADLDELCVELLRFDPATRPRSDEVLRRLGVSSGPGATGATSRSTSLQTDAGTFVGRSAEFLELGEAFAQVQAGHTLTVSVEGPSGIGKSALVTRFTQQLSAAGSDALVLQGRCYERETARFKALDGIIDVLATVLTRLPKTERAELLPRNAALLKQLFPVLGRVDSIARAPRPALLARDAVEERRWMFASLRELLSKLGERRALVLVIDDMHWADGDSLELLRFLLDASHEPSPRLLLLVTSRVPWLGVGGHGKPQAWPVALRIVELAPLLADDAARLARTLLERHGTHDIDVQLLARESGGHPLFVAELARHASTMPGENAAPLTLDGAIWERARALPELALRVLRILAVAAAPVPVHVLELATSLSPTMLERQLGVLRIEGFARSQASRERRAEPYHDRVREAVLEQLNDEQRRELHLTLAALLEQEPGVDFEQVGQHYLDAGDHDRACVLYERAARRAEEGFAFERAALLYRLQLTLRAWPPAEQSALQCKVGGALARAGQGRAAADAYAAALEGADDLARVNLRYLRAAHLLRSGYLDEGLVAFEEVLTGVGLRSSKSRFGAVLSYLWEVLRRRLTGYRIALQDPATVAPQTLARADALFCVAQGMCWIDGMRAAPLVAKALTAALQGGERSRVIRALGLEAVFVAFAGSRKANAVQRLVGMLHAAAAPSDSPLSRGHVALAESSIANSMGDFRRTYDKATEALALFDAAGSDVQWERASTRYFRLCGQFHLGRIRELAKEAPELAADADARKDLWFSSLLRMSAAPWCVLCSDPVEFEGARATTDEAYRPWRDREPGLMHSVWLAQRLLIDLFQGRGDKALHSLASERAAITRSGILRLDVMRLIYAWYRGLAHLLTYLARPGPGPLREVLRCARSLRSGPTCFVAIADSFSAQIALAEGRTHEALELIRRARHQFETLGTATQQYAALALEGSILGGDEGAQSVRRAHAHFRAEGVTRPEVVLVGMAPLSQR
jgi:hypothetical protein